MKFKALWRSGMKASLLVLGILTVLFACTLMNSGNEVGTIESSPQKATASGKFIGNIFGGSSEPTKFSQYWDQVTPENAGKWESVESSRDSMNWSTLDAIYNYAKQKGFPFKMHTLVWGQQYPSWITSLSAADQKAEVEEWIQAVGQRYPNMDYIDVVNEPLHSPPPYRDAIGGNGTTGWDWVVWAFQKAKQYCSGKRLINEYGIISDPGAADNYLKIINILKASNLIDGIGIQCHAFNMDSVSTSTMKTVLDKLAATGLPIYVSELDMNGDDSTQLARYKEKFPVLWEHSGVKGVTLWGYIQGQIWQTEAYLLRSDGTERPALTWLMQYVKGTSSSSVSSAVSSVSSSRSSAVSSVSSSRSSVASSISSSRSSVASSAVSSAVTSSVSSVQYTEISVPFTKDGAGEFYWKTKGFSTTQNDYSHYINSWNLDALTVNGTSYVNKWVPTFQIPASSDGYWYIYYKGSYAWSHFEVK